MHHLDILIPFGLPQSEIAPDLLRTCHAPALAMLLARSNNAFPPQSCDPFARALPHERWLSRQYGLTGEAEDRQDARGNSPPVATAMLRAHRHPSPEQAHWFVLQPAHIHIARDHLVLTDIGQLALNDADSRRLFQSALPLCEEVGRTLVYLDATIWLLRADDWAGLRTSSPQAASGRNIDIWMPEGAGERDWRKLQNEVQMQWFSEFASFNEERQQRGQHPVNSLWLWGGGNAGVDAAAAGASISPSASISSRYQAGFNFSGWPRALTEAQHSVATPDALFAATAERGLLMLDALLAPGLNDDWAGWRQRMETLDTVWFAPLLQALRKPEQHKRLDSLSLILTGQDKLLHLTATPASLRKFWLKPALNKLAA